MQELRAAEHWINQKGWAAESEGRATCSNTGAEIELRLNWDTVKKQLAHGVDGDVAVSISVEASSQNYRLEDLDPTQRVFADRVLSWATTVVKTYKEVRSTGRMKDMPKVRSWLGGSAGSGNSTRL